MNDTYTHGHHDSVLRSHRWRTAENSAAYLLPHLSPGMELLDVGCGPGTITVDLAASVAPGRVTGIDREPAVKVLQHVTDPVAALVQMRRVLRPDGILAVRDSDYGGFVWAPSDPLLNRWLELYHQVCSHNGADADAGRHLLGWAQAAGFSDIRAGSSTWTFADAPSRVWWSDLWAERVVRSALAEQAISYRLSTREELEAISSAWHRWAEHDDAFFVVVHAELIARR